MRVEACCQFLLNYILPKIDPKKVGTCIDVGVGTFAFYCEQFAKQGFAAIAIEPLPVPKLRRLCAAQNITLIEKCLSDSNDTQTLHIGKFGGTVNANFNSLAPEWFGSSAETKSVQTLDLPTLITSQNIQKITCLKIDVEGWEPVILKQLPQLDLSLLPDVVMFEYGGGKRRKKGVGGWSEPFFQGTLDCFKYLQNCGYQTSILVDYAPEKGLQIIDLADHSLNADELFDENAIYGNAICLREATFLPANLESLCRPYQGGIINWFGAAIVAN